jgi:hypothetical protein
MKRSMALFILALTVSSVAELANGLEAYADEPVFETDPQITSCAVDPAPYSVASNISGYSNGGNGDTARATTLTNLMQCFANAGRYPHFVFVTELCREGSADNPPTGKQQFAKIVNVLGGLGYSHRKWYKAREYTDQSHILNGCRLFGNLVLARTSNSTLDTTSAVSFSNQVDNAAEIRGRACLFYHQTSNPSIKFTVCVAHMVNQGATGDSEAEEVNYGQNYELALFAQSEHTDSWTILGGDFNVQPTPHDTRPSNTTGQSPYPPNNADYDDYFPPTFGMGTDVDQYACLSATSLDARIDWTVYYGGYSVVDGNDSGSGGDDSDVMDNCTSDHMFLIGHFRYDFTQ